MALEHEVRESTTTQAVEPGAAESRAAADMSAGFVERRRPGRRTDVSPHLIPLLRNPAGFQAAPDEAPPAGPGPGAIAFDEAEMDSLRAVKGVLTSAAIGIAFWMSCFGLVSYLLNH